MFSNNRSNFGISIPPVTKNLLIINIGLWLIGMFLPEFGEKLITSFGLHYISSSDFNPFQLISYMFMHDTKGYAHIFFNMFALFSFGRMLEMVWGSKRFLIFYMVCGIGAALIQEGIWAISWEHDYISAIAAQNNIGYEQMEQYIEAGKALKNAEILDAIISFRNGLCTIGASGAIFGILLGFAFIFPNIPMYIMFIPIPIKAKYMVIGYAALEFVFGVSGTMGSVAHFAHLGGMLFGLIFILIKRDWFQRQY